jgi:heat shock protein HslJ
MKTLKVVLAAIILLGGVLVFNACQSLESPLEGYNWVLYHWLRSGQEKTLIADTQITIYFNEKDKTFSGTSGCNQYSGSYKLDGLTLTINKDIMMTLMSCGSEKDEQERLYLDDLKQATNFVLDHGHLKLYCGQNIMQFQREGSSTTTPNQWGE